MQGTYSTSQCTNGNRISFSKAKFVGNYAEHSGGAVALWGCIGTVLHIDKSEFYYNTTPLIRWWPHCIGTVVIGVCSAYHFQ